MVQCQVLGQMRIGLVNGLVLGPVRIGLITTERETTHGKMVVTPRDRQCGPVMMTLWEKDGMTQVLGRMKIGLVLGPLKIHLILILVLANLDLIPALKNGKNGKNGKTCPYRCAILFTTWRQSGRIIGQDILHVTGRIGYTYNAHVTDYHCNKSLIKK